MKEVIKVLIIICVIVAALSASCFVIIKIAKENGIRETEKKQQVVEAERDEKAREAKIDIEKIAIEKVKSVMKNKYTRD